MSGIHKYYNPHVTQKMYEKRMKQQAINDCRDREMAKEKSRLLGLQAYCDSDAKIDSLRRNKQHRQLHTLQKQRHSRDKQIKDQIAKEKQTLQEERILDQFKKHKSQKEREECIRKRICNTSDELKDLKKLLSNSYLNMQLQQQCHDNEKVKQSEKQKILAIETAMEQIRLQEIESDKLHQIQHKNKLLETRHVIESQLREKEQRKEAEYLEFLKEKQEVDAIMEKIEQDKLVKLEKENVKKQETREFIQNYLVERQAFMKKQRQMDQEELAKIQEFENLQNQRYAELERIKADKKERDRLKYESVKNEIESQQKEKEAMQDLINELAMEERQLKIMESERQERIRKDELRIEMQAENMKQKKVKALAEAKDRELEAKLRIELLSKFENDDRLEQLSKEKKRIKMLQYKRDVEDIISERKKFILKEKEIKDNERLLQEKESVSRQSVIQQERIRLIKQHAPLLGKFLLQRIASSTEEAEIIKQYSQMSS